MDLFIRCHHFLFGYAAIASLLPVWVLLQPRDYINGLQLFIGLIVLYGAIVLMNPTLVAPAFNTNVPAGTPSPPPPASPPSPTGRRCTPPSARAASTPSSRAAPSSSTTVSACRKRPRLPWLPTDVQGIEILEGLADRLEAEGF